jgi:hypothetical protein
MLNYKRVLLAPSLEQSNESGNLASNYDEKIKNLKKEIKELTDRDRRNDTIDKGVFNEGKDALEGALNEALNRCDRKIVNKLFNKLDDLISNGKLNLN